MRTVDGSRAATRVIDIAAVATIPQRAALGMLSTIRRHRTPLRRVRASAFSSSGEPIYISAVQIAEQQHRNDLLSIAPHNAEWPTIHELLRNGAPPRRHSPH